MRRRFPFAVLLCALSGGCAKPTGTGSSNNNHAGPVCGNSVVESGEACDDGNTLGGDGCSPICQLEQCGNGTVDPNETCDDGNVSDGDGCSADCLSDETCGNGVADTAAGEVCDDGNQTGGDGCSADCFSDETCGNGVADTAAGEVCDDGNQTGGDGCSADCLSDETCGNGIADTAAGEACDDGNQTGGDGCSADCLSDETCGNGIADTAAGEECDGADNAGCGGNPCRSGCVCSSPDPCLDPANVGDPSCRILSIEHTSIGSCGFGQVWRGQDISFANGAVVTGVEFQSSSSASLYDEMRLMTSVSNLATLAASTNPTRYQDGSNWWERVAFSAGASLDPVTEYTVWFHLLNSGTCTPGCDLSAVNPNWGGHHTDTDPAGQSGGSPPYWNYQYGTNVRVYGVSY